MYFRIDGQSQILRVPDSFARLTDVAKNGDMSFEFTYSVSQEKAIQRRATRVVVSVESRSVVRKSLAGETQRGRIDTRAIVDNVRTAVVDAKSAVEQQARHLVARRVSDITVAINNEVVPLLRARVPSSRIPSMNKPRLVLTSASESKRQNDHRPLLHRVANSRIVKDVHHVLSSSMSTSPQALMHDMITRQGIDPTYALSLTPRTATEASTHGGLSNTQRAVELDTDPASQLLNYFLFPPTQGVPPTSTDGIVDTDMSYVIKNVVNDEITIPVTLVLPSRKRSLQGVHVDQLYVTFELLDSATNLPIDAITRVLDVSRHVRIYNTPKLAPSVGFSSSGLSGRINLEIKQRDKGASEVQVYKKAFWIASPETDGYALVGSYALSSNDQSLLVQVDVPKSSPVLYRVIPVGGQSMQGFEFTNVAVKPPRYVPSKAVSFSALQSDTGVQLEIRQIPTSVVAVQFLRWNLTTRERGPTTVGSDIGFIDDSARRADLLSTIDSAVVPDNIYRYQARLIYRDGHTTDVGNVVVDFLKPSPGQVDTRIEGLNVSHDDAPNVTFSIKTSVIDGDIDAVKKMLDAQGLSALFSEDVLKQRDQLRDLIAYNVQRVDLLTGQREDFGIITEPDFNDDTFGKKQAVRRLEHGHRYRYEVYPLLRAPETLFDSYVKQVVDPVTKKPYGFSPAKFLHPFTLKRGVLVTTAGARLRHGMDPMSYGAVGSIATVEVSFDTSTAKVVDPTATAFDRSTSLITWSVLGDIARVDHFVILKQVHGIRSVLGKAHSSFANGSCQYVHELTQHDAGVLQYVIVPVFNDYKVGQEAITNSMVVESP